MWWANCDAIYFLGGETDFSRLLRKVETVDFDKIRQIDGITAKSCTFWLAAPAKACPMKKLRLTYDMGLSEYVSAED